MTQGSKHGQFHAEAAGAAEVGTTAEATATGATEADPRRWWILAVLCVSLLLVAMDNSILNVAVPTLSRTLHADTSGVQLIVDAFTVVYGGLLMAAGSLADRWGRKQALLAGLAVFGAGSAAASLVSSAGALTGLRAVMGAGAALVMPATLAIINSVFTGPERARAIGAWSAMSGAGLALGPLIGGALLERFWWGSVFLVNVPVCAAGLAAVWFLVPASPGHGARGDLPGTLLSVIGLGSAVYAIIEGPSRGWASPAVLAGFAAGTAGLAAFTAWEARTSHPMLRLSFFRSRRFSGAITVLALMFLVLLGSNFLVSQYFQFVRGLSALAAGAAFLPLALALLAVSPFSHRLTARLGTRATVACSVVMAATGTALLALSSPSSPLAVAEIGLALIGAGMGGVIAPAVSSILGSVPPQQAGVASAVNSASLQAGGRGDRGRRPRCRLQHRLHQPDHPRPRAPPARSGPPGQPVSRRRPHHRPPAARHRRAAPGPGSPGRLHPRPSRRPHHRRRHRNRRRDRRAVLPPRQRPSLTVPGRHQAVTSTGNRAECCIGCNKACISNQVTVCPPRLRHPHRVARRATRWSPRPSSASLPVGRGSGTPGPLRSVTSTRMTSFAVLTATVTVSPGAPEPLCRRLLEKSSLTSKAATSPHG